MFTEHLLFGSQALVTSQLVIKGFDSKRRIRKDTHNLGTNSVMMNAVYQTPCSKQCPHRSMLRFRNSLQTVAKSPGERLITQIVVRNRMFAKPQTLYRQ